MVGAANLEQVGLPEPNRADPKEERLVEQDEMAGEMRATLRVRGVEVRSLAMVVPRSKSAP